MTKNLIPPLPIEVEKFETMAVKLINDDICTQHDLQRLMMFSRRILNAETERQKRLVDMSWHPIKPIEVE